jgi:hypothetical protein
VDDMQRFAQQGELQPVADKARRGAVSTTASSAQAAKSRSPGAPDPLAWRCRAPLPPAE